MTDPKSKTQSPKTKFIYRGNPVVEPPPPEIATLLDRHRGQPDALITVLEEIQRHYGYLAQNHLRYVCQELGFPLARIYGVATFYNLFLLTPPGKHQVRVCRGTACHVNHSAEILKHLIQRLAIGVDETTPDGRITLQTVACVGACSLAPVIVVDADTHGRMTPQAAWAALEELDAGEPAMPEEVAA